METLTNFAFIGFGLVVPVAVLGFVLLSKRPHLIVRALIGMATVILAANLTLWPYLFLKDPFPSYYYESSDLGFRAKEFTKPPGSYPRLLDKFSSYQKKAGSSSVFLCRTFSKQPLKFWMWREYLFEERWQLPFKESTFCAEDQDSQACDRHPKGPPLATP